jgi:hypothetical protein
MASGPAHGAFAFREQDKGAPLHPTKNLFTDLLLQRLSAPCRWMLTEADFNSM